ncbi:hypothetical protein Tco_0936030 [Tanacetum coccineum]
MTARLPILNPADYDRWLMRIKQYFLMTDYSLWEVIKNGNKVLKRTVGTVEQEYEPTTTEEKQDKRNEMKAIATLLMALPNKDQLMFHSYQDAKFLMEAIEKRYGGNKESKKVQRTLLKKQYKNFAALSSETMDQTFDSTNNTTNTNKANNTTYEVSTAHTQEDLEQLHPDGLEEIDLQWEMVMLTIKARRFIKRTGRKLDINGQRVGFDKSKLECYNCQKMDTLQENVEKERDQLKQTLEKFQHSSKSLNDLLESQVIDKFKTGLGYNAATAASPTVESFVNLSDKSGSDKGYHSVSPPLTGNFIPRKPDLTFIDEIVESENTDVSVLKSRCQTAEQKLSSWDKKHRKYRNERDALTIEKAKIEEELVETKLQLEHRGRQAGDIHGRIASFFQSDFTPLVQKFLKSGEFNRAFVGVLNTAISVGVERGLHMDRTDEEFRELSQRVVGFVPDAKEKFDRVVAAFPNTTFPFLDKVSQNSQSSLKGIARLEPDNVTPSHQTSSATTSLRANTYVRHSTSSSGTFGYTSTLEHLKKKKKPVEKGGPSAV